MRSDAIGLFWQDLPRKKGQIQRAQPPIPDTGWLPPTDFPRLDAAKTIAIDVETYDPDLKDHGPGWARHKGHIVGLAIGTEDGFRRYYPMRHEVEPEYNINPEHVLAWARHELGRRHQPKLGANITYDVGWLREEGVRVEGPLLDVEFAEALLDEEALVNLDAQGQKYLGTGKETNILYQWCSDFYGGPVTGIQRGNIYRAPPRIVGPYAEGDVDLPFHILEKQWPLMYQQGLLELFDMENRLIPLMLEMRFKGVRVDLDYTEAFRKELVNEVNLFDDQIQTLVGFPVNCNASASMAEAFDSLGIPYNRTKPTKNHPNGQPSFKAGFLETVEHPLARLVLQKKQHEKLIGTFIDGYILGAHINGRVHGSFNQLRGDEGGTRSGRFSSSNPNLQNIPFRTELGKRIRRAFIPEHGHKGWRKDDYNQIEYRALAHYAMGPGSDDLRRRYNEDPRVDFHKLVKVIIQEVTGLDLDRPLVKNINFGTAYGMGEFKLRSYLNLPDRQAKELMEAIHNAAPFLRSTMEATIEEVNRLGYITTILGRRSRFDRWVPKAFNREVKPLPYHLAIITYQNIVRAATHKGLNRRLQGSAADLMKKAMLECWEGGIFAETGVPLLTVHDELDFSDPGDKEDAFCAMTHVMENCIKFRVPIKVETERGPSWGQVQKAAA